MTNFSDKTLKLYVSVNEAFTLKRAIGNFYNDALSGDRFNMARIGSQIDRKMPVRQYEDAAPTQQRLFP